MQEPPRPSPDQPEQIGRYRILRRLGEGGMGVVYLAEQTEPVRRLVALKILKAGMDTRSILARFEAERQALALMDHPGIARVLDAGQTPAGRPYFVMERVAGVSLTTYCDKHEMSIKQRLELFISICHAVQHAHEKGIVHRDLKPDNVLVAEVDDQPVAKIIDFGIAKSMAAPLSRRTLFTQHGALMGTPEYMSPEQAESGPEGVDGRADVYSLGAILYELLAGTPPFTPTELRKGGLAEIQRILREIEPPTPGRRIGMLGSRLPEVARARQESAGQLARHLRGDLTAIVMKALDKSRFHRYGSVQELVADLRRNLDGLAVRASRGGAVFRLVKRIRRHRGLLGTGALAVVTTALLALVLWQWQAPRTPAPLAPLQLVPLTPGRANGAEPSFSPDGRQVAFASDRGGDWDLWILGLGDRGLTQVTHSPAVESFPSWSPDGSRLAFARRRLEGFKWDIWITHLASGRERKLVESASEPAWSPDGKWILYADKSDGWSRLVRMRIDGAGEALAVTSLEPGFFHRYPDWSPRGNEIVYKRSPGGGAGRLMIVAPEGGPSRALTSDGKEVANSWGTFMPDGRHVVYASDRGGTTNLWRIPSGGGQPERLTSGAGNDTAPAIAPDGRTIVFTVEESGSRLIRVRPGSDSSILVAEFPRSSTWFPVISPDGTRIVYVQKTPGSPWGLQVIPATGGTSRPVLADLPAVMGPRFHSDGQSLIFFTWPTGLQVGQVGLDGRGLRWLTSETESASYPDLSPDGTLLAYVGPDSRVFVRDVTGGEAREVARGTTPAFSPDGSLLAIARTRSYAGGIGVVPLHGGGVNWLTDRGAWPAWLPHGRAIGYIDASPDGFQRAEMVSVSGGPPQSLAPFRWQNPYSPFVLDPATGDLITTDSGAGKRTLWMATFP